MARRGGEERDDVSVEEKLSESTRVPTAIHSGVNAHETRLGARRWQPANWTATSAATQLTFRGRRHREALIGTALRKSPREIAEGIIIRWKRPRVSERFKASRSQTIALAWMDVPAFQLAT
ncbi:hypothetical protein EYF80_053958 [Liparis tanakae]|uniref:Uncharacterized protein n=1 Tax=Liparis tanakae TaxID=230148 RepID=A0A4Z2F3S1_9TELE|nr:hypothetical protein EYF80_053958 [Liparis tanakae]